MKKYIDPEKLPTLHAVGMDENGDALVSLSEVRKALLLATVDDVEQIRRGEWEPRTDVIGYVRCSVCKDCNIWDEWADGKKWRYCPHCGAKMDEQEEPRQ